jgi:hypothetical protein
MKIGYKQIESERYQRDVSNKQAILEQAIELASTKVTIEKVSNFTESFTKQFLTLWEEQNSSKFPEMLSTAKQLELAEFPFHILSDLETKYKEIRLPENPNFDIVITKEQVATYKSLQDVCKAINASKQHLSGLVFGGIIQMYRGALNYDFKTQTLTVNPNYFNGYYQRA